MNFYYWSQFSLRSHSYRSQEGYPEHDTQKDPGQTIWCLIYDSSLLFECHVWPCHVWVSCLVQIESFSCLGPVNISPGTFLVKNRRDIILSCLYIAIYSPSVPGWRLHFSLLPIIWIGQISVWARNTLSYIQNHEQRHQSSNLGPKLRLGTWCSWTN